MLLSLCLLLLLPPIPLVALVEQRFEIRGRPPLRLLVLPLPQWLVLAVALRLLRRRQGCSRSPSSRSPVPTNKTTAASHSVSLVVSRPSPHLTARATATSRPSERCRSGVVCWLSTSYCVMVVRLCSGSSCFLVQYRSFEGQTSYGGGRMPACLGRIPAAAAEVARRRSATGTP